MSFIKKWEMPQGDPSEWTLEEEAYGHFLGESFAEEYTYDWDVNMAAIRLGADPDTAYALGQEVRVHPITQYYIKGIIETFEIKHNVTRDKVLALLHRDACDFSDSAKPSARVGAQKQLSEILGMKIDKREIDLKSIAPVINLTVTE